MTAGPLAVPGPGTTRTPLRVDVDRGRLETAGQRASFDPAAPDSALIAYLKLVRKLRDVEREPSFVLRRDDVVVLAGALRQDAVVVLDRLGELMGATVTQRRSMVTAFLAGALLIAVATGATALAPGDGRVAPATPTGGERSDVAASAPVESSVTVRPGPSAAPDAPDAAASTVAGPTTGGTPSGAGSTPVPPSPTAGTPSPGSADVDAGADVGDTADVPGPPSVAPPPQASAPPADQRPARWRTGPEIVQPGATIDIPSDADDGQAQQPVDETPVEDIPVGIPVVPDPDLPLLPLPPVDDVPVGIPVVPDPDLPDLPVHPLPPVTPPVDVVPPVTPPVDVVPPVTPPVPEDDGPGQGNGNAGQGNSGVGVGNGGGNGTGNEGGGVGPGGNAGQGDSGQGQGNAGQGDSGQGQGNAGEGNSGVGRGNGGGNGTGNEGGGVGPR